MGWRYVVYQENEYRKLDKILLSRHSCRTLLPYTGVLGLAAQSVRWQQSMQNHMWNMAREVAKAAALQEKAAADQGLADELAAQASVLESEGEELVAQGKLLLAKSEEDSAIAAEDQTEANALFAKVAEEEAAAATELGEAAVEETIVQEETAEATADATFAARDGFEAKEDETIVGACEVIPVLDIVCDVVGGVAAVGLETAAATEAAHAATEYAAAVAAQIEEESQVAQASALQEEAAQDELLATNDQTSATELEVKAQEELTQGQEQEATGKEKLAQSAAANQQVEVEEAQAAIDEETSTQSTQKAIRYGAAACWDGMMGLTFSFAAFAFFAARLVVSFIFPATIQLINDTIPNMKHSTFPVRTFSYAFHHVLLFCLLTGCFGRMLLSLDTSSIRARGGIVLQFSLVAALSQSLLLHFLPETINHGIRQGILLLARCVLTLSPLFLMESILLQVTFGPSNISPVVVEVFQQRYLWIFFGLSLVLHHLLEFEKLPLWKLFEKPDEDNIERLALIDDSKGSDKTDYGSHSCASKENNVFFDSELESDCTSYTKATGQIIPTQDTVPFWKLLYKDLDRLVFPFELLTAATMFALLRHSLPNVLLLWPASKAILVETHPHWEVMLVILALLSSIVLILSLRFSLRRNAS